MTMDIHRLIAPAPEWIGGSFAARIDQAASLLFLHGYISQSQRTLITCRIEKQFMDAIRRGDIVEVAQGTSASGQDPQGLEAEPAGPVRQDAPDHEPTQATNNTISEKATPTPHKERSE